MPEFNLEGKVLGDRYEVTQLLGEGRLTRTWLGRDRHLSRLVVVRIPRVVLLRADVFVASLDREARGLTRFAHPNLVRVLDVCAFGDVPCVVSEWKDGGNLADRLDRVGGREDGEGVAEWLAPVALALDHVHRSGAAHGDLRPGAVLFDAQGHPFLGDFGIARARAESAAEAGEAALAGAADQAALAALAAFALTGRETTPADADRRAIEERVPKPAAAALLRALSPDPAARFPTCEEFAASFRQGLAAAAMPVPDAGGGEGEGGANPARASRAWFRILFLLLAAPACYLLLRPVGPPPAPPDEPSVPRVYPYSAKTLRRFGALCAGPDWRLAPPPSGTRVQLEAAVHRATGLEFVLVPGGSCALGSGREVTIPAFLLGRTECTRGAWGRGNGLRADASRLPLAEVPASQVEAWCVALGLRLPSEAEWEYAARAGEAEGPDRSEFAEPPAAGGRGAREVGELPPDAWGLFDTLGGVRELCADDWSESPEDGPEDGSPRRGDGDASRRVARGGSRLLPPADRRIARRTAAEAAGVEADLGFRPAASLPLEERGPLSAARPYDGEILRLLEDGTVLVGSLSAVAPEELTKILRRRAGRPVRMYVVVDPDAEWSRLVRALEALEAAGHRDVSLDLAPVRAGVEPLPQPLRTPLGRAAGPITPAIAVGLAEPGRGEIRYLIDGQAEVEKNEFLRKVSSVNAEFAEKHGADYASDPRKTPWTFAAPARTRCAKALEVLQLVQRARIPSVRFAVSD